MKSNNQDESRAKQVVCIVFKRGLIKICENQLPMFLNFFKHVHSELVEISAKALSNCSYPAVYSFNKSLLDVGNSIIAFPDKFALSELDIYRVEYLMHTNVQLSNCVALPMTSSFEQTLRPQEAPHATPYLAHASFGTAQHNSLPQRSIVRMETPYQSNGFEQHVQQARSRPFGLHQSSHTAVGLMNSSCDIPSLNNPTSDHPRPRPQALHEANVMLTKGVERATSRAMSSRFRI
uniref:Uncharacterized protein n=1 Tax=Physcomitrium patens TaxID=3218 RepID=A9S033_PHYPA|nr:hypothetical protein PHYPA_000290 [Physcomitrium patens]